MQNPKRATAESHAAYPRIHRRPWSHSTPPPAPVGELIETRTRPAPDEDVIFGPTLIGRLPDLPMTSLRTVLELCDTRKLGGIDDLTERLCDIDTILSRTQRSALHADSSSSHTPPKRILSYLHATSYDDSIWVQQCLLGIGKRFCGAFMACSPAAR